MAAQFSHILLTFLLLAFAGSRLNAQKLSAPKTDFAIGDRMSARLDLPKLQDKDTAYFHRMPELTAGLEMLDSPRLEKLKGGGYRVAYSLTAYDSGVYRFGIPSWFTRKFGWPAVSDSISFRVFRVAVDTSANFKDIYAPPAVEEPWDNYLLYLFAFLTLMAALMTLLLLLKARRDKKESRMAAAARERVFEQYSTAVSEWSAQPLAQGEAAQKAQFSEIYTLTRRFTATLLRRPLRSRTTRHLIMTARNAGMPQTELMLLQEMLQLCDRVKFSRTIPSSIDKEEVGTLAGKYLEMMKAHFATERLGEN